MGKFKRFSNKFSYKSGSKDHGINWGIIHYNYCKLASLLFYGRFQIFKPSFRFRNSAKTKGLLYRSFTSRWVGFVKKLNHVRLYLGHCSPYYGMIICAYFLRKQGHADRRWVRCPGEGDFPYDDMQRVSVQGGFTRVILASFAACG